MNWSIDDTSPLLLALVIGTAFFAFVVSPLMPSLRLSSRSATPRAPRYLNLCGAGATPNIRRTPPHHQKPTHTLPSL